MTDPVHDMPSLEREFLGYAVAQAHPKVREWRGEHCESDLRQDIGAALGTLTDDVAARRVAEIMVGLGVPASSYRGLLLEIGDVRIIAHIDFTDVSGAFAFVKLRAASVPLGSVSNWPAIAPAISRAFGEFRPRALHLFHPSHLPLRVPTSRIDAHVLAASARSMAEQADAPGLERIELRRSDSLDFYPLYEATYAQMLQERPQLKGEVKAESRETLGDCLQQGLLFEIFVDDAWSGLVAARPDRIAGVCGLQVVEIVLTKNARGQGLGVGVHQRLTRCICRTDPAALMIGTISPKNLPSLRTAIRAGRLEIGAYRWLDL